MLGRGAWLLVLSGGLGLGLAGVASCSTADEPFAVEPDASAPADAGAVGPGDDGAIEDAGADGAIVPSPTNPYGAAYPTAHLGFQPRSGTTPGSVLPNLAWQGYVPGADTFGTVSMSDYYDPESRSHDVVLVVYGAVWEPHGANTLKAASMSNRRVTTLVVLGEGYAIGVNPTLKDLASFRAEFPFAGHALDPEWTTILPLYDPHGPDGALPYLAFLDARTMEIAYGSVGALETTAAIDAQVDAITARPPAY